MGVGRQVVGGFRRREGGWVGEGGGGMSGCCCSFGRGRLRTEEWRAPVAFLSAQGHLVDAGGTATHSVFVFIPSMNVQSAAVWSLSRG